MRPGYILVAVINWRQTYYKEEEKFAAIPAR